jgi:hypothetical protein
MTAGFAARCAVDLAIALAGALTIGFLRSARLLIVASLDALA